MIPRKAATAAQRLAKGFPVVAVTGPRQSGKTTLARALFADKAYVSLENPDEQAFAERDPRAFLKRFGSGPILDEVQRCPQLLSWLQGLVDERGRMGDFVLTGSAQFDLIAGITQSLAGRVGRIELLPLTADGWRFPTVWRLSRLVRPRTVTWRLVPERPATWWRDCLPTTATSASGSSRAPRCIFWMSS